MEISKDVSVIANYKLSVCSDVIMKEIMKVTGCTSPEKALRKYEWPLKHVIKTREWHNLVPLVLRTSLATLISWTSVTPTFKANHIALGSDSTPASNSDTQLWTETLRAEFWDRRSISNQAFLDKNFGSAEVGGNTYNEIGVFVDGTGIAPSYDVNSWYLLSRININQTMAATENLTINVTFTINW